ncbi:hypothetical protein EUGRSUZ_K01585 [Eucalyptus grandis]|uniref:Uncharacterized protein n=2 Tax=Eucalyptus grandis TaxID=71139 RepID=A0ACC3IU11_EUCGR|nr:hypothetical protein EUGRSUZ_K01585 [Eucalyptus grandis]
MWLEDDIIDLENIDTSEQEKDCRAMLIGKLFMNPNVNVQVFQSTMKTASKIESVDITPLEQGQFLFAFKTERDSKHVLNGGPWSFANHCLLLKAWEPNTPSRCYNFSKEAFWVHIFGLPVEWRNAKAVLEIKVEPKGGANFVSGKVKVELDLFAPLKQGSVVKRVGQKFWLEYKYERLPHFCYACGKLGHYTTQCAENQVDLERINELRFGYWLKAEAKEFSPICKMFYEDLEKG